MFKIPIWSWDCQRATLGGYNSELICQPGVIYWDDYRNTGINPLVSMSQVWVKDEGSSLKLREEFPFRAESVISHLVLPILKKWAMNIILKKKFRSPQPPAPTQSLNHPRRVILGKKLKSRTSICDLLISLFVSPDVWNVCSSALLTDTSVNKLQTARRRRNPTLEGWMRWGCALGRGRRGLWFAWTIVPHKFGCFFLAWTLLAIYFHSGWLWRGVNSLCSGETQRRFCAATAPYSSCNACKTNLIGRLCHFDVGPECEWPWDG